MKDEDSRNRRYTENEFALILRKAAEIQESPREGGGAVSRGGFSLEEIRSIADEAGIDPEAVSRAAALLGALEWEERKGLAAAIFGGPGSYHLGFEVEGRLPPAEMGRVLEVIRREAAHQGRAAEVLGGVEWKTVGEVSVISVNISPRGDSTSIQIVGDRGPAGGMIFIFPMIGSAVLVGIMGAVLEPDSVLGVLSLVGGLLGSGFLLARTLWVSSGKKFHTKLTRLMEGLAAEVGRRALPPASSGGEEA